MIEAELPDGTVLEFPEGTSPEVVQRVVKQRLGATQAPPQENNGVMQQLGNLAAGAVRGAGSIGATVLAPYDIAKDALAGKGLTLESNRERRQSMTDALQTMGADPESLAFQGTKLLTEIGGTAGVGGALAKGAAAIPAVAKYAPAVVEALRSGGMSVGGAKGIPAALARIAGGSAVGGVSAGLVDPDSAATGAMIGGAIPAATQTAGLVGRAVGRTMRPSADTQAVAQTAQRYGIPLGLGDVAENKAIQATRSILRDAPISGGMAQTARESQQEAFNKAVGATFGAPEKKLTLDVLDQAKKRLGGEFDRIWNNNVLQVDPKMVNTLQTVRDQAQKLPTNEGGSVLREIDDLYSKMVPDAQGNLIIPGDVANKFQSYLRRRGESFPALSEEFGQLRRSILDTFNASVTPADAAALTLNRSQYKAFKTVEPILRSAELGIAGRTAGDIPAALLPQAVNRSYGNLQNAPLAELSQVGSRFLVDRTSQTGGSARAALQNTAIGAALMGTGGLPALVAGVPAAAGLQKLMQSPGAAQLLMGQGQISPQLIQALRATQMAAPVISAQ